MKTRYRTNLRCASCVESIRPALDGLPGASSWSADVSVPEKWLTVEGPATESAVTAALAAKGYRVLGTDVVSTPTKAEEPGPGLRRYWPLLLILLYLLGLTGLMEWVNGRFDTMRAMAHFMAGFFLTFSFFKLLNLRAFADSYAGYDLVAKVWPRWGLAYPFVELGLGVAYVLHLNMTAVNAITLVVMLVGTAGVAKSLLAKRTIQCACLGAVFNLPMSWVTLVEDLLMAGMAAAMLAFA